MVATAAPGVPVRYTGCPLATLAYSAAVASPPRIALLIPCWRPMADTMAGVVCVAMSAPIASTSCFTAADASPMPACNAAPRSARNVCTASSAGLSPSTTCCAEVAAGLPAGPQGLV